MLDHDPTIGQLDTEDDRPLIVQYINAALSEWTPLFSVENGDVYNGSCDGYTYVALRLDLSLNEYYSFSTLHKQFNEYSIVAEKVGIDTTTENDLPRLILQVNTFKTNIDIERLQNE